MYKLLGKSKTKKIEHEITSEVSAFCINMP